MLQRACVALGDDPAPVDHHDGERGGESSFVVEDPLEQRFEVDAPWQLSLGPVLGGPRHAGRLRGKGDERAHTGKRPAHTEERKDSSAALVSAGFSCCTQWAAPSTTVVPR